ncbi:MAG: hypothetical protein ABH885_00905 [Candidatus Omnitrophota bacterium]
MAIFEQVIKSPVVKGGFPLGVDVDGMRIMALIEGLAQSPHLKKILEGGDLQNRFFVGWKDSAFDIMRQKGLPVYFRFRDGYIYPETVTSDASLLREIRAGYVVHRGRAICDWKDARFDARGTLPIGIQGVLQQDHDPVFRGYYSELMHKISNMPGMEQPIRGLARVPGFEHLMEAARSGADTVPAVGGQPAGFQAYLKSDSSYYSADRFEFKISGQVKNIARNDASAIVAAKNEFIGNTVSMPVVVDGVTVDMQIDKRLAAELKKYDIDLAALLTHAASLRKDADFAGMLTDQTIALLDKSESLFEDHMRNGFIGVNAALFEVIAKQVPREALGVLLAVGLTHEFRHEAGVGNTDADEIMLSQEDAMVTREMLNDITNKNADQERTSLTAIIDAVNGVSDVSLYAAKLRESAAAALEEGRLFMPEYDFKQGPDQGLEKQMAEKGIDFRAPAERNRAVIEAIRQAMAKGEELSIEGHLRGIDGPGSSLDLPEFQKALTEAGLDVTMDQITSTPTIASEFKVKIRFELAENPDAIEYVAPDYFDDVYSVTEPIQITPNTTQKDAAAYIFMNIFGLKGIRIICDEMPPVALAGDMESSNVANVALISAASMLSGRTLSQADVFSLAVKLENDELNGLTGGQGHLCTMLGGAFRHIWLSGIKNDAGEFVNPYGAFSEQFLDDRQLEEVEKHTLLVQAGKDYKVTRDETNGAITSSEPTIKRTAAFINYMWTDLLRDRDAIGFELHKSKLALAAQFTKALQSGNYASAVDAMNKYVEIRDKIAKRWIQLALDAHFGKTVDEATNQVLPGHAARYADKMFNEVNVDHGKYSVALNQYRTYLAARPGNEEAAANDLKGISFYTLEPIAGLIEKIREHNAAHPEETFAIFPLGAGGPSANLVAMSAANDNCASLIKLLQDNGIMEVTAEKALEAKAIIRGEESYTVEGQARPVTETAEGIRTVKGWIRFKAGKEPMKYTGFAGLQGLNIKTPELPQVVKSNQVIGDRKGPVVNATAQPARFLSYATVAAVKGMNDRIARAKAAVEGQLLLPTIEPFARQPRGNESSLRYLARIDGYVMERYNILPGQTVHSSRLAEGRPHRLFVESGEVRLADEQGNIVEVKAGEVIEWDSSRYTVQAPSANAVMYAEYKYGVDEADIYAGYEAFKSAVVQQRLAEAAAKEPARKKVMLHVPKPMYAGNEYTEEKRLLERLTGGAVQMDHYDATAEDLERKSRQLDKSLEHVFIMYDTLLQETHDNPDLLERLKPVLSNRILPVKAPKKGKHVAMIRELEATGVVIGLTQESDLTEGAANPMAEVLQNVMTQLVGSAEPIGFDILKNLLGGNMNLSVEQFKGILNVLIRNLVPLEKYDMDQRIQERRQILWAA